MNIKSSQKIAKYLISFLLTSELLILFKRSLVEFRGDAHDFLSYHLHLALSSVGATTYIPRLDNWGVRKGYPPLAHFVMGILSKIFSVSATGAVDSFGLLLLAGLLFWAWRKNWNWFWILIIFFAVPMFPHHIASGYIDLWVACGVLLAVAGFILVESNPKRGLIFVVIGTLWALFSKVSAWPVSGLCLLYYFYIVFRRIDSSQVTVAWRGILSIIFVILFSFWPMRNVVKFGNPTFPYEPAIGKAAFELLPRYQVFKEKYSTYWRLGAITEMAVPSYLQDKPRFVHFLSSSFEFSRLLTDQKLVWSPDQFFGGPQNVHHRQGGWFFLTWSLLLIGLGWMVWKANGLRRETGLFLVLAIIITGMSPQCNELRYYLFIPLSIGLYVATGFKSWPRERMTYFLKASLLISMLYVQTQVFAKTSILSINRALPSDFAPLEAREYWKNCPKDKPAMICADDPLMIYWSGPTFNECPVRGCFVNCFTCDKDYRKDAKSLDIDTNASKIFSEAQSLAE